MVESIVVDALANVEGDLAGKYFALAAMSEEVCFIGLIVLLGYV